MHRPIEVTLPQEDGLLFDEIPKGGGAACSNILGSGMLDRVAPTAFPIKIRGREAYRGSRMPRFTQTPQQTRSTHCYQSQGCAALGCDVRHLQRHDKDRYLLGPTLFHVDENPLA